MQIPAASKANAFLFIAIFWGLLAVAPHVVMAQTTSDHKKEIVDLTVAQESRAAHLESLLKCPVCKGQSLGASDSFMALEMKRTIRTMVRDGHSDQEVLQFFIDRYTEWILLKPQAKGIHIILYLLPLIFAALAIIGMRRLFKKNNTAVAMGGTVAPASNEGIVGDEVSTTEDQNRTKAERLVQMEIDL